MAHPLFSFLRSFFHRISRMNRRHSCLSDYSRIFAELWLLANGWRPIYTPVVFCHADFADDADFSLCVGSDGSREVESKPMVLACLGDEPYNPLNRSYIEGADWMMCEAFCLYADRDTFKPYEKCHSTALDAGKLAAELGVKNLILYHTEEKTLASRKEKYSLEAAEFFKGRIVVPDDLEVIEL